MLHRDQQNADRLLKHVGKLQLADRDFNESVEIFAHQKPIDVHRLTKSSRVQGVLPQVYYNLQSIQEKWGKNPEIELFLNTVRGEIDGKKQRTQFFLEELRDFAKTARDQKIDFVGVKGISLQDIYPSEGPFRNIGDVDLVLSEHTAWSGINILQCQGYRLKRVRLESYSYYKGEEIGRKRGVFGVAQMEGTPCPLPMAFDLHLGVFPGVGDCVLTSELWQRVRSITIDGVEIYLPSIEDILLIICSHISRHGHAKMKDLNDIHACLIHTEGDIDWGYLSHFAKKNSLQAILYGLLTKLSCAADVKFQKAVLAKLKPKSVAILTSKVLFSQGKDNPNFHGGRKLIVGRFLQFACLYNFYRDKAGFLTVLRESFLGLYFLFQHGRPYRLWKHREILSFRSNQRVVIIPIELGTHKGPCFFQSIHLQRVEQFALHAGVPMEWIGREIIVWNIGHSDELILTTKGFYTQSAYNGDIDEKALETARRIVCEVAGRLKQAGAIEEGVKTDKVSPDVSIG